ncbi:hypothetical protein SAMN05421820_102346 [Pedobacter steynii]|uniref:Uncharacterized protein n=1 Tax=Pedobacter steynii TaxID=430522 RepID=A0A1G9NJG5_9SPHI|nr:DUF5691 domain-containing protein [Pedobacter steynii]NQX39282.1 hypothetical protein [Pedobacter steynii]SDL86541.1 hypothetical protein SAMN05421820_102346 [Pedobacter steynii]
MKVWEYIVNSAMLGSDKPAPGKPDLPEELVAVFDQINNIPDLDRESKLLQQAAIASNYRKSGFQPLQKDDIKVSIADPENLPYVGIPATLALNKVLHEGSFPLLELWMQRCSATDQLVRPDLLPDVLDKAEYHSSLRKLAVDCTGNRGKWLSQFNPDWDYFGPDRSEEEIWLNGKSEERISLLKTIRLTDPGRAREMIIQTWSQENVAQKLEFLKCLRQNKQISDLSWLESLSSEKGQKVKDEIQYLLREIPGSSIIQQYEAFLSEALTLKKEKALLGMLSKTTLQYQFPELVNESIYKSGIEKLAGANSKFTDEQYITSQVIQYVPPAFWEKHLEASREQVVAYFVKYAGKFVASLGIAVSRFNEKDWVPYFLDQNTLYADFLEMMDAGDQEKYLGKFKESLPNDVIHYALNRKQEWSSGSAAIVLKIMAADPGRYRLNTYKENIGLIPVEMLTQLGRLGPENQNVLSDWENIREELLSLLLLKQQILQAFINK